MKDERDDFWDIAKLLPERKSRLSPFSEGRKTSLLELTSPDTQGPNPAALRLTGARPSLSLLREYSPKENPLLLSVTVEEEREKKRIFATFLHDAERYAEEEGAPAPYVPFFSYSPQYSQLRGEQLAYYLFWRRTFLSGDLQRLDKSYFFLFVYETVVLAGRIFPPEEGLRRLLSVYEGYRREIPEADRYLSVWIADFCLLHALPCPPLSDALVAPLLEHAELKEFYLGSDEEAGEIPLRRAFSHTLSLTLFKESDRPTVKRIFSAAERGILRFLAMRGEILPGRPLTLSRRAFYGSPCASALGVHLKVTYRPFFPEAEVKNQARAALRHAENHLRRLYAVKGRLSINGLSPELADPIDRFFASLHSAKSAHRKKEAEAPYNALYEAEEQGVSFSRAEDIEAESWHLTRLLLPVEEAAALFAEEEASAPAAPKPSIGEEKPEAVDTGGTLALLAALLKGHADFVLEAERQGLLPPLAAERVNELSLERLGDIIMETDGDRFRIVEEYREDAREWLNLNNP